MAPAESGRGPARGRVVRRKDRLRWLCSAPQPPGRELTLTIDLPGFDLEDDGSLRPAGPPASASLVLLGRVRGCRFWPPGAVYVLRLSLLGRVWPTEPSDISGPG